MIPALILPQGSFGGACGQPDLFFLNLDDLSGCIYWRYFDMFKAFGVAWRLISYLDRIP